MIITIDGPSGVGKSTAARRLARALGFDYMDTGALYRTVTVLARHTRTDPADRAAVKRMLSRADIAVDGERVRVNGRDVSDEIRLPEVSAGVRPFAENPDVREFVKAIAHHLAEGRNVVVEGRDMGTVVFPEAEVKIYLTASIDERARRRFRELIERGIPQPYEVVVADIAARDHADMTRAIAPLRKPDDAVEADSSGWTREETSARLAEIVRRALDRAEGRK